MHQRHTFNSGPKLSSNKITWTTERIVTLFGSNKTHKHFQLQEQLYTNAKQKLFFKNGVALLHCQWRQTKTNVHIFDLLNACFVFIFKTYNQNSFKSLLYHCPNLNFSTIEKIVQFYCLFVPRYINCFIQSTFSYLQKTLVNQKNQESAMHSEKALRNIYP